MASFEETAASQAGALSQRAESYCATCDRSYPPDHLNCPADGTKLVHFKPHDDTMLGRVLDGRYRIERKLGNGGMGSVYRGRQLSIDRDVAIKVIHPAIAADREVAKRFLREARLSSSLNAPGIVAVYDFGQTSDGVLYLVMELIEGKSLAELVVGKRPLEAGRVAGFAMQLFDALDVAHGKGIIHRDLKPANIIVLDTPTGEVVKVLDFGIAKAMDVPSITSTAGVIGTPIYMAPEQFEGRTSARSDLYSLGCVLHELARGEPPFTANDINTLLTLHLVEPPPPLPPTIPHQLARVIERLLAKDPIARFASAADARAALAQMASHAGAPIIRTTKLPASMAEEATAEQNGPHASSAPPLRLPTPVPAVEAAPPTKRGLGILIAGVAAAGLVGAGVFVLQRARTRRAIPEATPPSISSQTAATVPAAGPTIDAGTDIVAAPADAAQPIADTPSGEPGQDAGVTEETVAAAKPVTKRPPTKPTSIKKHPPPAKPTTPEVELPFVK